jgi:hypothetical protein
LGSLPAVREPVNTRRVFSCLMLEVVVGSSFTVFFDGTFWVGVVEVGEPDGSVRAARHLFGSEPTGAELWEFVRRDAGRLIETALASPAVAPGTAAKEPGGRVSPKRLARLAARQQQRTGPSTVAQAALSAAMEASAKQRKLVSGERRRAAEEQRQKLRAAKRKARHRGR